MTFLLPKESPDDQLENRELKESLEFLTREKDRTYFLTLYSNEEEWIY